MEGLVTADHAVNTDVVFRGNHGRFNILLDEIDHNASGSFTFYCHRNEAAFLTAR